MNYHKIYDDLIARGLERGWTKSTATCYVEKHHIVPRCIGGEDVEDNLVYLTAREHFIAHWLLSNLYKSDSKHVVHLGFLAMCQTKKGVRQYKNSVGWAVARQRFSEFQRGRKLSPTHLAAVRATALKRRGVPGSNKGKVFSREARDNMSQAAVNRSPALGLSCIATKDGVQTFVPCLFSFCKENNFNCSNALKVIRGLRHTIQGYSLTQHD